MSSITPASIVDSTYIDSLINAQKKKIHDLNQQLNAFQRTPPKGGDPNGFKKTMDEIIRIQGEIKTAQAELDVLNRSRVWFNITAAELKTRINGMQAAANKLAKDLQDIQRTLAANPTQLNKYMKKIQEITSQMDKLSGDMNTLVTTIDAGWLDKIYLGPYVTLYEKPNYEGRAWLLIEDAKNLVDIFPKLESIRVGSGATIYKNDEFSGISQDLYADIPQLNMILTPENMAAIGRLDPLQDTRLGSLPRSIRLWDASAKPYGGAWIILAAPGEYLSANRTTLTTRKEVAKDEYFFFDITSELESEKRYEIVLNRVTLKGEQATNQPIKFLDSQTLILVNEKTYGFRKFSLMAGSQWLVLDEKSRNFVLTDDPAKRQIFTQAIKVAVNENLVGTLLPGEIALYEHRNYWGRTWVMYQDFADFRLIAGLNDMVSSIRLGPNTGATIFHDVGFQDIKSPTASVPDVSIWGGLPNNIQNAFQKPLTEQARMMSKEDIHTNVPSLLNSQVGDNQISAMRAWRITEAVPYTAVLSQDYRQERGRLTDYSAYRITLQLPGDVGRVQVWATDLVTIQVSGKTYNIDEEKSAELLTPLTGSLVITIIAKSLQAPALRVRTNTMPQGSYFLAFPDVAAHKNVQAMQQGALWNAKGKSGHYLVKRDKYSAGQVENVQTAIQTAVSTIKYDTAAAVGGTLVKRGISTEDFQDAAWVLDFGKPLTTGAQLKSAALSTSAADGTAPSQDTIKFQWLSADELARIKSDLNARGGSLPQGILDDVGDFFEEAGDEIDRVIVTPVEEFGKEALQVIIDAGDVVGSFVLDSVEKVIEFVEKVIEYIGVMIETFIEWLQFLFAWEDILETQRYIADMVETALDKAKELPDKLKVPAASFFDDLEGMVLPQIDKIISGMGAIPPDDISDDDAPDFISDVMDKIYWVFDKLEEALGSIDAPDVVGSIPQELNGFLALVEKEVGLLANVVLETGEDMYSILSQVADGVDDPLVILGSVIGIMRRLTDYAFQVIKDLVQAALDVLTYILKILEDLITDKWNIPFFSDLYSMITGGQSLTFLNLTTLIIAIPMTVMAKLVKSDNWSLKKLPNLVQGDETAKKDFNIVTVVSDIMNSFATTILDAVPPGTTEGTGQKGKLLSALFGILEASTWITSFVSWGFSWGATDLSSLSFEADNSENSWATGVLFYEGSMLLVDVVSFGIGWKATGHPTLMRRLQYEKVEPGPIIATVLGAGHTICLLGNIIRQAEPDGVEAGAAVAGLLPELAPWARMKDIVDKTKGLSLVGLAGLNSINLLYLIGAAHWLTKD